MLLYIEDDEALQKTVIEIFEKCGMDEKKLLVAENLTQARAHMSTHGDAIKIVLSDNRLSDTERGFDFLAELLKEQKASGTSRRLILYTSGLPPENFPVNDMEFWPKRSETKRLYRQLAREFPKPPSLGGLRTSHQESQTEIPTL